MSNTFGYNTKNRPTIDVIEPKEPSVTSALAGKIGYLVGVLLGICAAAIIVALTVKFIIWLF